MEKSLLPADGPGGRFAAGRDVKERERKSLPYYFPSALSFSLFRITARPA